MRGQMLYILSNTQHAYPGILFHSSMQIPSKFIYVYIDNFSYRYKHRGNSHSYLLGDLYSYFRFRFCDDDYS